MEVSVDSKVRCLDGEAGQVTCLIINPITDDVTHVVIHEGQFLGLERIVPLDRITRATSEAIWLDCKRQDLHHFEPFMGVDYDFLNHYMQSDQAYWPLAVPSGMDSQEEAWMMSEEEEVPPGEVAIHRGTPVYATDGQIGHVHEFVANPTTGGITHVVLSRGHLWGKQDIAIPLRSISKIEQDKVELNIDKDAVRDLPRFSIRRSQEIARPVSR